MTDSNIAIKVEGVSKTFKLPHEKHTSLKGLFLSSFSRKSYELQQAVKNVSFEVEKGEFFGIVGRNGSGKSTLLKMLAGIYMPDKGSIKVDGRLVPFIELGVGFNSELTGRENVFLNGALLGFDRQTMSSMYDGIVEFAELEKFMDQKLKNYSSGMQVRLAFSIAIRAQGNILLLDEVLAVGDVIFQQKCFNYFHQLKKQKKTVLLVSHDINVVRQYCDKGILLENGEIVSSGKIDKILNKYIDIVSNKESTALDAADKKTGNQQGVGTGKVLIKNLRTLDDNSKGKKVFGENDDTIAVQGEYQAQQNVETPVYGIVIKDASGARIFASNNMWNQIKSRNLSKGQGQKVTWILPNIFKDGEYYISTAVADNFGKETFNSIEDITAFIVRKKTTSSALINPAHKLIIDGGQK